MRRKDREITDLNEILSIIKKCDVCRIALFDEAFPYIVPLNFGVEVDKEQIVLYFHSAGVGKKIDLIKANKKVAFEMDCEHRLVAGSISCHYTMEYESVCGNGEMTIVGDEEKVKALKCLMKQYVQADDFEFNDKSVRAVTVLKLTVQTVTGKRLNKK
ncbi:MAG: pyridoxamine 5'-phosphate oxidase family protein [Candidatus Cellulosilyticum pullistercoris]|uniref:Pyridoxamine 5'-phosphate oxidase family protein n=1 Tax=Candidatus Cellulosilyticum pullistercoris TaxID=2838521 RepID=A0A9E2KBF8_9FIRM|nr:pyridoxamine 5'-phosphate oxidase family protein [Candidatus Cellulosilyticum pullistercoris]